MLSAAAANQLFSEPPALSPLNLLILCPLSIQKLEYLGNRFFTVKLFILQSFLVKKKKSNGNGMSLSIVKIFNIARTTAAFHSTLLFKLQLISIYYMKRTARAPGITGMGSQATGRDRESRNAWSVLGCQDRDM